MTHDAFTHVHDGDPPIYPAPVEAALSEMYYAPDAPSFTDITVQLNQKFNTNYSRNALMAKAKRMGLKGKKPASSAKKSSLKSRVRLVPSHGSGGRFHIVETFEPSTQPLRCIDIEPRHLTLMALENADCRYPYGDDKITFCGHRKLTYLKNGREQMAPYCPAHQQLTRKYDVRTA